MSVYFPFFSNRQVPDAYEAPEDVFKAFLDHYGEIQEIYQRSFYDNFNITALSDYSTGNSLTYGQLAAKIATVQLFFEKAGVRPGDHVAIIGRNSSHWVTVFMATILYGAVAVPILNEFSPADITNLVNHSDASALFIDARNWKNLSFDDMPALRFATALDDYTILGERDIEGWPPLPQQGEDGEPGYTSIADLAEKVVGEMDVRYPYGFRQSDIYYPRRDPESVCVINYTSGTSGFSKGVMLTFRNLWGNIVFGLNAGLHYRGSRVLSFLPLAHAYGCSFDMLLPLAAGTHITLLGALPSPTVLIKAMGEVRPSLVLCVPLVLEKIYRKMIVPMISKPPVRWVLAVPMLDKAVYGRIRSKLVEAFGGEFEEVIVGGAALNQEVEDFLHRIRFPFTVGYGMTECGPLISYSPWRSFVPGSCGRALKGMMKAKLGKPGNDHENVFSEADEGEILVKGINVMKGYYKNPEATAEAIDKDGWLHTGDMGLLAPPDNRTIFIRGRYKSMILRPNGQNIYPEEIEAKLDNMPYVGESVVLEREGKLVALIYPDTEAVENDNISPEELRRYMDANLAELNRVVAAYERVASYEFVDREFEKTPKRSIKRFMYK